MRLVAAANAWRWSRDASGSGDAERQLDALFHTSRTLAVYATPNRHVAAGDPVVAVR